MKREKIVCALWILMSWIFPISTQADVIIRTDGSVITGNVLQQDSSGVLVQMSYGTFRYRLSLIKDVRKENVAAPTGSSDQRIPNWAKIISALATNTWAHELKQIPATVIDNGVLENVPYISFRCNSDGYEINVYGDPDKPAGVEIGAVNYLAKSDDAKSNCVNFISSLLGANDGAVARSLNVSRKDLQKWSGITFETTFPDEADAYGGWWISVYDEGALTNARASGAELLAITQPRIVAHPRPTPTVLSSAVTTPDPTSDWSSDDILYSRPSASHHSGGDRVYVRGYYRKDGTYVHSYTRSYPHRR